MKKIILSLLSLLVAVSASAQISSLGKSNQGIGNGMLHSKVSITDTQYNTNNISSWNKVYLSYVMPHFGVYKELNYGVTAGYAAAFKLDKKLQLFLEYGGALSYSSYSQSEDTYVPVTNNDDSNESEYTTYESAVMKTTETYIDVKIPVNLAYRINFGGAFSIVPYWGVNLKAGIIGSRKVTVGDEKESVSMYDGDKVGANDELSRINFGMQYGLNLTYKKLGIGIGRENDFTKICNDSKYYSTTVTLSYFL